MGFYNQGPIPNKTNVNLCGTHMGPSTRVITVLQAVCIPLFNKATSINITHDEREIVHFFIE